MTNEWDPRDKLDLSPRVIKKFKERVFQQSALPIPTQEWVDALRAKDISKVRKYLKKERKSFPTKFKRLYREDDRKLLRLVHFLILQYPFFNSHEKRLSSSYLETEQALSDKTTSSLTD